MITSFSRRIRAAMSCCLFFSAALLVAACDTPTTVLDAPSYDFTNNLDTGNPKLVRLEMGYAMCWTDPSNGLRVCNTTMPLGTPANRDPDCGLQAAIDGISHQHLVVHLDPHDPLATEWHANDKGDVWITVRDMTTAGTCFGTRLVAEGPGRYHFLENDINGTLADEHNANAWGFIANGTLTTPEGDQVRYLGQARWRHNNQVGTRLVNMTVRLTR